MRANRPIWPEPFLYIRECGFFVTEAKGGQDQLGHRRKLLTPPNLAIVGGVVKCNVVPPSPYIPGLSFVRLTAESLLSPRRCVGTDMPWLRYTHCCTHVILCDYGERQRPTR